MPKTTGLTLVAEDSVTAMAEQATCPVMHTPGVLDRKECGSLAAIWHDFSLYRPSSVPRREPRVPVHIRPSAPPAPPLSAHSKFEFATTLRQRFDAGQNFERTGGRLGLTGESSTVLRSRTDYFREIYATRYLMFAPGIEFLLDHEPIASLAARLYDLPVIVPLVVYANLLLPGQELGLHTDVPEFRQPPGVLLPPWLRVVMCHSGLFEQWRVPVATVIVYLGPGTDGGELAYFPDGPMGEAAAIKPREGEAVVLDADTTFHGVDRVREGASGTPRVVPASRLIHQGNRQWHLIGPGGPDQAVIARYSSDALRYSASWKGCCFADEADLMRWENHSDDLPVGQIIGRLRAELTDRGRLAVHDEISNDALGRMLVDEFVRFPAPATAPSSAIEPG
jgi:2OG-Fe(II) oxygenase superfamily